MEPGGPSLGAHLPTGQMTIPEVTSLINSVEKSSQLVAKSFVALTNDTAQHLAASSARTAALIATMASGAELLEQQYGEALQAATRLVEDTVFIHETMERARQVREDVRALAQSVDMLEEYLAAEELACNMKKEPQ
jgi:hypothetical protein